jgi:phenylalanyl-tRNA synthetase alpha chain
MTFDKTLDDTVSEIRERVAQAGSLFELEEIERTFIGKKGRLKDLRRMIASVVPEHRPHAGSRLDAAIELFTTELASARSSLAGTRSAIDPQFDPSVPAISTGLGGLHPIVQMMYDLNDAFSRLNFDVFAGPEISSELYEFDYMNFPPNHPARESMDTYWVKDFDSAAPASRLCLRPHLTGASVRYMQTHEPPYRFVYPGRVYRNESTDARHERAFFQYEALIVDKDVTFSGGKLLTSTVLDTVFGRPVPTRMRTGFFPFVEPGFEIDMQCQVCMGTGCGLCKQVGWLEIMPGGVPHPNVLRAAGLDPNEWTGFYVNVGLDRLVMMRYGIDDIRSFNGGDLRFLSQFK